MIQYLTVVPEARVRETLEPPARHYTPLSAQRRMEKVLYVTQRDWKCTTKRRNKG